MKISIQKYTTIYRYSISLPIDITMVIRIDFVRKDDIANLINIGVPTSDNTQENDASNNF